MRFVLMLLAALFVVAETAPAFANGGAAAMAAAAAQRRAEEERAIIAGQAAATAIAAAARVSGTAADEGAAARKETCDLMADYVERRANAMFAEVPGESREAVIEEARILQDVALYSTSCAPSPYGIEFRVRLQALRRLKQIEEKCWPNDRCRETNEHTPRLRATTASPLTLPRVPDAR